MATKKPAVKKTVDVSKLLSPREQRLSLLTQIQTSVNSLHAMLVDLSDALDRSNNSSTRVETCIDRVEEIREILEDMAV